MNGGRRNPFSNVDTIVDHQWYLVFLSQTEQAGGNSFKSSGVGTFVSVLKNIDATAKGGLNVVDEVIIVFEAAGIRDEVQQWLSGHEGLIDRSKHLKEHGSEEFTS